MFNRNMILILFCVLLLVSISSVCAEDNTNMTVQETSGPGTVCNATFEDLEKDITNLNPGDTYHIDQDYVFEPTDQRVGPRIAPHEGILISKDNITINGNGHTIDGSYNTAVFKVTGNYVKILNLTIKNCAYHGLSVPVSEIIVPDKPGEIIINTIGRHTGDMSPICWYGDNGLIDNCIFTANTAVNGGAVKWMGSNGVINNTLFLDNIARGIGGGLYIGGCNNTIANTRFLNSTSLLSGESIYIDRKHGNISFLGVGFSKNQERWLIDGALTGIDVEYLQYSYDSYMTDGKLLDIIPLIYKAIMNGRINNLDGNAAFYAQYSNVTKDFTFSLNTNLTDSIVYQKDFVFTNTTLNDVFKSLLNGNYTTNLYLTKSLFVRYNDVNGYEYACYYGTGAMLGELYDANIKLDKDISKTKNLQTAFGLNVVCLTQQVFDLTRGVRYEVGSVFNSNRLWYENSGFDVINIFGNGARIHASSDERDENYWFKNKPDATLMIYDLTIEGFNMAIINEGYLVLNNVVIRDNKMDYYVDRDDGAGLLNTGIAICNNCSFINNYAKNGGAIFNQGALSLNNCTFKDNEGYGTGNDVLNVDKGIVLINGEQISGSNGVVTYVESISTMKSIILGAVAAVGTFLIAFAAGFVGTILTVNPVAGIAVGVAVGIVAGGIIGSMTAYTITSQQYNLNFNRINTAILVIGCCVVAGMMGGTIGGFVGESFMVPDYTGPYVYEYIEGNDLITDNNPIYYYIAETPAEEFVPAVSEVV